MYKRVTKENIEGKMNYYIYWVRSVSYLLGLVRIIVNES